MKECSKSIARRLHDVNFTTRYFVGEGLDIGGKPDPLMLYMGLFGQMRSVRTWDWEDGDAQFLSGVDDGTYDFVHSSHCLEHLMNPREGLHNWLRTVKPGGFLIITVPDEDMYEQGQFPSTYNRDHKWTFTIHKSNSWSDKSLNILALVSELGSAAEPVKIELLNSTYRYDLPRYDQTLTPVAECGIEVVIRRRTQAELVAGGRMPVQTEVPAGLRVHLNQYRDDLWTLKESNKVQVPFCNDTPL
jgi:SAM-dependent methyltransferase